MNSKITEAANKWLHSLKDTEIDDIGERYSILFPEVLNDVNKAKLFIQEVVMPWWEKLSLKNQVKILNIYKVPFKKNYAAQTPEEIAELYLKEHESKEQAGLKYGSDLKVGVMMTDYKGDVSVHLAKDEQLPTEEAPDGNTRKIYNPYDTGFNSGLEWQKEHDKAIIRQLIGVIRNLERHVDETDWIALGNAHQAITKAEQYLNQ